MRIKWLHLSDIHFNYKNFESHSLREDFLKRIQALTESEPFTHLFITGDILYRYQKADDSTVLFIQKLVEIMQLPFNKVYFVPGNHDHNRDYTIGTLESVITCTQRSKKYTSEIDNISDENAQKLLNSFENYDDAYYRVSGNHYYSHSANPHFVSTNDGVSIISINTAWLDKDSRNKDNYLLIGSRQLQLALTEKSDELNNSLNIAIGHHTLEDMKQIERFRVLDQFRRNNVGIYFCGHRHKADIIYHSEYDVVEFVSPGGFNDGYSDGGYIWGVIDTDADFYKAEVYSWYDNKWCIESKIKSTDEYGIYYFNTQRFKNASNIVAIDCKTMGTHIPRQDFERSLGCNKFDTHIYSGPIDNIKGYTDSSILDFCDEIKQLIEKNEKIHLYPLAPIPMLLSLGFYLQKDSNITIHQFDRKTGSWVLNSANNDHSMDESEYIDNGNSVLAVAISTSFLVEQSQIEEAMGDRHFDLIHFKTSKIEPGYPLYSGDVDYVVNSIITELNSKVNKYKEIHIFAAIPAGMAVQLGRGMLTSVYSNIFTYQLMQGAYTADLIINPQNSLIAEGYNNVQYICAYGMDNLLYLRNYGRVPCNIPKLTGDENYETYPICDSILGSGEFYLLEASGDSMINAGIEDGDLIVIRSQSTAENGQIVVACIDGETTLKRFFKDDDNKRFVLHPENEKYEDIVCKELNIQGVAVNIIKSIE